MKKQLIVLSALASVLSFGPAAQAAENVPGENPGKKIASESAAYTEYQVTWNAVSGAANYKIKIVRVDTLDEIVPVTNLGTERVFKAPHLKSNTQFRIWVAAYDSKGKLLAQKVEVRVTTGGIDGIIRWNLGSLS